ncbi:ABC transporter ATP-binding protein [Aureimonas sp. SA4125]|uniref:ABC transporter ATP-binding protein n=1 Tax=Aureimonas sp. SA4125 TaxID=2826993 RepID=UPI0031F63C5B
MGNGARGVVTPSGPDNVVLAVRGLSIRFQPGANLVEGVDLTVRRGETLCIVGESGCGKSITALALMGLLKMPPAEITGGTAHFEGADMLTLSEDARSDLRGNRISMIFQEPMTSLNPAFTIGDQIAESIVRHRKVPAKEAAALALDMLRKVRIPAPETRYGNYPHQMSGGMRQRVMIAMALANSPRLLVADEPTTALDVTIQAQILDLIKALQDDTGTAVIMITHDLAVVAETADHVAVMYAGHIVESGPVAEIFADPQHPYTIGLMGAMPSLGRREAQLTTIFGTVPSIERMPTGCRFAPRCPFVQTRCTEAAPPLGSIGKGGHRAACWYAPLETHFAEVA